MSFRPAPKRYLRRMVYPTVAFAWVMYPFGNPAAIPHDRLDEQWWQRRHDHCVRMSTYGRADVAFLGDSITQNWENDGEHVWDTQIAPLKAANFGFGGDRTEHV